MEASALGTAVLVWVTARHTARALARLSRGVGARVMQSFAGGVAAGVALVLLAQREDRERRELW
jgi:hypothetical protein